MNVDTFDEVQQSDSIEKAIKYLPLVMRFDRNSATKEVVNQLNAWSGSKAGEASWKPTQLLDSLSTRIRSEPFFNRIDTNQFGEAECEYLLQCQMMRDIGRWICEREYLDPLYAPWLEEQKKLLPLQESIALEKTLKLFDWTVRNIAMDGNAKDVEALPSDATLPLTDLGMGYRMLPWQTMHFGRGDAWQRIRVFHQLLFQQEIAATVLAKEDGDELHLWCSAIPIGKSIYLFEPRWGLPFPMADEPKVVSLQQAKTNPTILRRAKLPGRFDYPLTSGDLKNLVALIDVEPFALGRNIQELQDALTGENSMRIFADADAIATAFRKIDPDVSVRLWELPWLAFLYKQSVSARINDLSPFAMNYRVTYGAYLDESLVSEARSTHFRGQFDTTIDTEGAAKKYMNLRIDEETLGRLFYDRATQQSLQVVRRIGETPEEFQSRVQNAQEFYRIAKIDSNAFLGMLQFDLNNYDASINWMDQRLLQIDNTDRWRPQARYILGRAFEQKKDWKEAAAWYKIDGSPQDAGNRVRVRLIEKMEADAKK